MPDSVDADIQAFFDSYRSAFERREAAAIADHFRFPLHVTGGAGEVTAVSIPSVETWIPQLERLLAVYTAIHWALENSTAKTIYEFDATYTLAGTGASQKITAIAHNEQLRARETMTERASGPA